MKLLYGFLFISMMSMVYAECEIIDNQIDCEALEGCEWHADEMACEDSDHTHDSECDDCMDYCVSYVMENYGYTEEEAATWCLSTPNDSFGCADVCEDSDHDDDHGHDEHVGEHIFEITGLSVGSTTFTISIMHQGHADYTSLPILVNVTENCLSGDVNQDQLINIIDVVQLVQAIISGNTDELSCVDLNNDGNINIVDVVALVQFIVNTRTIDATEATLKVNTSDVTINANGYIGGVQMTLVHENDFSIELTNEAYVADYNTVGNQTMLVIVAPENNELFTYNGDFEILDYIVANSSSEVSTTISEMTFDLGVAYPNPFNPTTNLSLTIPEPGYVNVSVFNIVGQQIAELANGNMESGVYNLTWNASNASSGMYLVKAEYSGLIITQKLMLLK